MPADGGTPRQLSQHATPVSDIAWHPDGSGHLFPRQRSADRRAARARAASRRHSRARRVPDAASVEDRRRRTARKPASHSGDYSLFGYRIAANGGASSSAAARLRCPPIPTGWSCGVSQPTAATRVQLTKNKIPEVSGEMSPDGSQVLFLARANDRLEPYYNANVFLVPRNWRHGPRAAARLPVRGARGRMVGRQQVGLDGREHGRSQPAVPGRYRIRQNRGS